MSDEAIFTLTLERELRDEFVAAAEASDQSPTQILKDMMQDFILQQKMSPDHLAFMQEKTTIARKELAAGEGLSEETVEKKFAAMRAAAAAEIR